ncbi:bile acid:sodium symporter family protein [Cytophagaceae bacterium 50C-KIRBA]|uniref:Bile acid:sodium symporter family protein n=1 Tax=Aquirufa beregesia TaxID=2516556 RepID=A0ABX0EWX5_9BACT|nr:bile acid:sodium symporter family protein [Aquirufa beregesia]NGZ44581.1 bile acid:sodium symporter family protein [Aquirufa beregesia]
MKKLLTSISFSFWIIIAVIITLIYPNPFLGAGGIQFKIFIIPLLQLIMFGMGSTMGVHDFQEILKSPKAVFLGVFFQFSIMPLVGWGLTKVFDFPTEIAAGIILVGCMPCGLASNVMSYLAKANVALSLTLTSIATFLAPILTPFLMKTLAGQLIEIHFWDMVWEISKLILIPIVLGVIYNKLIGQRWPWFQKQLPLISMLSIAFIIVIITANGRNSLISVGPLLVLACFLHNIIGFILGYWGGRATGLPEKDCRTIAIEVGLQNAGLASGLAMAMGKVATLGLPAAIFGPLMNINGSTLANYWKNK